MVDLLKNKQILSLFISSMAVMFTGMGLFPILPLYAARFDASSSTIGFYLAVIYAANALSPVVAGWLISRFSMKAVFVASALVGLPALLGLAAAQSFAQVVVLTSLLWFSGGAVMALVSVLTGLHTDQSTRGRAFSLMAMVGPLGALAGGGAVGQLIAWQGYGFMFAVLAVFWIIVPLTGLFLKESPRQRLQPAGARGKPLAAEDGRLGAGFARLMAVAFLGSLAVNVSRFGSSLSMQAQQFTPEAVSSAAMISGLVAIPATLAIGAVSDRLGRRHLLFASYLFAMSGSLILVSASTLWQFWLAAILHLLAFSVSGAMAQALAAETAPAHAVSKGLSYFNTLMAVASILTFAAGGVLYDLLGMPVVFLIGAVLALAAGMGVEAPAVAAVNPLAIAARLRHRSEPQCEDVTPVP